MKVLVKEHADLGLVRVAHGRRRHGDLVPVPVPAVSRQRVHARLVRDAVVEHPERGEVRPRDGRARVVRLALVALEERVVIEFRLSSWNRECLRRGCRRGRPSFSLMVS